MNNLQEQVEKHLAGENVMVLFTGDKCSSILMKVTESTKVKAIFLDTGFQFDDILKIAESYGERIHIIRNDGVTEHPDINMRDCCYKRKSNSLADYLSKNEIERLIVPFTAEDNKIGIEDSYLYGVTGISIIRPFYEITNKMIWSFLKSEDIPSARIYNKGYRFVDCKCCITRFGRRIEEKTVRKDDFDIETEEKLKALGYM